MRIFLILLLSFHIISCNTDEEAAPGDLIVSEALSFTIDTLATGLENPWGTTLLPDGRILIAERPGRLRIFHDGQLLPEPVQGLPSIWANGQGGLLDVVLHPNYEENQWIYIAYAAEGGNGIGNTAISRGRLVGNQFTEVELLFHGQPFTGAGHHFGARILFDDGGYMYLSIGDRGNQNSAQDLSVHNGSVMRFYDDGQVPQDNPFIDEPGSRPEIWAHGLRNTQGMALHPVTRQIWGTDHGALGGDEINILSKGGNYGWPMVTHSTNYNGTIISPDTTLVGMADPIFVWPPPVAPCGISFVSGDKYPGWENNLLVGALSGQHIHRVVIENDKVVHTERLLQGFARFRDIHQGTDGYIYVLTEAPGMLLRIVPWERR